MKRLALILCIILAFSAFASCSPKRPSSQGNSSEITSSEAEAQTPQDDEHIFSLGYFAKDSLNPYKAKQSANFYLGSLIYDSLFLIDENFKAVPLIAEGFEQNGSEVTVIIKNGLKFSDGSAVTANDVAASFKSAKSSSYYSQRLSDAISCTVKNNSVIFKLRAPNKHFVKNLTFPIIKGGSTEGRAVGSGRFMFDNEQTVLALYKNKYNTRKTSGINSISLVEIHKYSTLPYMIKIGSINLVYAPENSSIKAGAAKTSAVLANNLIYLGVNSSNQFVANQDFRKALSLLIDRKNILTDVFANSGFATASPFNPKASDFITKGYSFDLLNTKAAAELFNALGYTQKNEKGFFTAVDGTPIVLRLAVNNDNSAKVRAAETIKLALEKAGVGIELIKENSEKYMARIASGDYDLFLGEIKLTADNDISSLLNKGALNMCDDAGETLSAYNRYLADEITLADFLRTFDLKTPFIPIMYRSNSVVYSGTLSGKTAVTEYDVFADMENWIF